MPAEVKEKVAGIPASALQLEMLVAFDQAIANLRRNGPYGQIMLQLIKSGDVA